MKKNKIVLMLLPIPAVAVIAFLVMSRIRPSAAAGAASVDVYFSPHGGCTEAVLREIGAAKASIRLQAYSFTRAEIATAIVNAQQRGVLVEALLDRSNQPDEYAAAAGLLKAGCDVRMDSKHAISHDKVMIVDEQTVVTGSFDFTKGAEDSKGENLLVIHNQPAMTSKCLDNFRKHQKHSDPYDGSPALEASASQPESTTRPAKFVGAKSANVYHHPTCRDIEKISPADRVEWDEPPPGKRLHKGCPK